jgi:hypothetical protein
MAYTLGQLCYLTAREIGGGVMIEGTATGGSTNTIIDTVERTEADDFWNGATAWIIYDSSGGAPLWEQDIILDFASTSDTITLRTGLTTAVASGDKYALCKKRFPLQAIIQQVNNAIQKAGAVETIDTTSIRFATNKTEYSLPLACTDLRQVWCQGQTNDSDDNRWTRMYNWYIQKNPTDTSQDLLVFPYQPPSNYYAKLVYSAAHSFLTQVSDKLDKNIDFRRIIYRAAANCLRWYMDKTRQSDVYSDSYNNLLMLAETADRTYPLGIPQKTSRLMFIDYKDDLEPDPGTVRLG